MVGTHLWQGVDHLRSEVETPHRAATSAPSGARLPPTVLLGIKRPCGQLEGIAPRRLLGVAAQQALVDVGHPRLRQVGVGPAVEVPLLRARLPARRVGEGLERLVGVDEVLVPGLGRVLATRLAWVQGSHNWKEVEGLTGLALVLQVVGALLHPKRPGLGEPVLLAEATLPGEVVVCRRAT